MPKVETSTFLVLLLGLLVAGCPDDGSLGDDDSGAGDDDAGDDDSGAGDDDTDDDDDTGDDDDFPSMQELAGWYRLDEATFPGDDGPVALTREEQTVDFGDGPMQAMIRGWVEMAAIDDDDGDVLSSFGIIAQNLLTQVMGGQAQVEVVDWLLLVHMDADIAVYEISIDGDTVTLVALPEHPETTTDPFVLGLVLTRMDEPVSEVAGMWTYLSFTYTDQWTGDETVVATTCSPAGDGVWARVAGGFGIEARGNLEQDYEWETFSNDTCAGAPDDSYSFWGPGFFDGDEVAGTWNAWIRAESSDGGTQYVTFESTYVLDGDTLTVEIDPIYLLPPGGQSVPSAVTMERQ